MPLCLHRMPWATVMLLCALSPLSAADDIRTQGIPEQYLPAPILDRSSGSSLTCILLDMPATDPVPSATGSWSGDIQTLTGSDATVYATAIPTASVTVVQAAQAGNLGGSYTSLYTISKPANSWTLTFQQQRMEASLTGNACVDALQTSTVDRWFPAVAGLRRLGVRASVQVRSAPHKPGMWAATGRVQKYGVTLLYTDAADLTMPIDLLTGYSPGDNPCDENCLDEQTAPPRGGPQDTADPVRYADGALIMYEDDLSVGTGDSAGFIRSYSNLIGHDNSELGASWTISSLPRIVRRDDIYMVRTGAHRLVAYQLMPSPAVAATSGVPLLFSSVRNARESLNENASGNLVFADPRGVTRVFHGFGATVPVRLQGRLMRIYTNGGMPTSNIYDANGVSQQITRMTTDAAFNEVIVFEYNASGLMSAAERRRVANVGGAVTVVCRAEYGFDDVTNQLRSVVVKGTAGEELRRFHYRYYTTTEPGSAPGMLRNAVGPRTYARMQQVSIDPETASDAVIGQWADKSFQYDSSRRVTQQILRTPDVDGSGTFTYSYTPRTNPPPTPGSNDWTMQFVEQQPDGSINTVFTNQSGEVMFKQTASADGVVRSAEAYRFDAGWRATWHITPAAMQASGGVWFDANQSDLLGFTGGNSPFVRDAEGLIRRWTYYAATDLPNGAVVDQLQYVQEQVGELGTPVQLKKYTYMGHAAP